MKILGIIHKDKFIFSRTRHDYRTWNGVFIDGGQPWINSICCRTNSKSPLVWVEIEGITADCLVNDWNLGTDNYGIESIKDVKILSKSKWPKINFFKWKIDNAVWGVYNSDLQSVTYKLLKDLTSDHLKAILETQNISKEYRKIIIKILKNETYINNSRYSSKNQTSTKNIR